MTNQHVLKRPDGSWAVLGEGNGRDTSREKTQGKAIQRAKKIAENQGGDVIVHRNNNKIRGRNTYSKKDPFPPRG